MLINGGGPNSSDSACYIGNVWYGPRYASGYGAGGSGGCLVYVAETTYIGGTGANGVVYIEY